MRNVLVILVPTLALVLVAGLATGTGTTESGNTPGHRTLSLPDADFRVPPGGCPVCAWARRLGLEVEPLGRPKIYRCGDFSRPSVSYLPRGEVLAQGLRAVHIEVDERFPEEGVLMFTRNGDAVHLERFFWEALPFDVPIPPAVMGGLGVGDVVTWGVFGSRRTRSDATFRIAELSPAARRLASRIARLELAPALRSLLRAELLLGEGFDSDAARSAKDLLAADPDEPHAIAVLYRALVRTRLRFTPWGEDAARLARDAIEIRRAAGLRCALDVEAPEGERPDEPGGCGG